MTMTRKQRHDYYQRTKGPLKGQANARKTHCPRNHEYTPENTYAPLFDNTRACRTCNRERKSALAGTCNRERKIAP